MTNAAATLADNTPWQAYRFGYQYDPAGNPVEQDKNGLVFSNSFNHLNQNVATVPGGSLAVMGRVNYAGGTVAVNSVQAQLSPDLIFAATGIPFSLGTNALNTVFTDPFGRSTNRETSVVVAQKSYQYDANGNLTNDGRMAYFWNDENRLVAVRSAKSGALIQENRYDGLGRRREKIEHGADGITTNRYIYQNWLVLAVTDGAGNVLETYTHGDDLSGQVGGGAGGIGGILASTQEAGAKYYHYDFNGNIVNVSSSNQTQWAKYTYSPFGEVLLKEGAFDSRYQFSTKEMDGAMGMNYFGYRFYSPSLGRWINRDPIEELGSINIYEMSFNNFINNIDYLGLCNPGDTQTYLRNCHIKNGKKTGNYTTEQENNWWLLIGSGGGIVQVKFICNCEVEGDNYCDEVTEECKCKKTSIKGCCVIGEYDWVETNVEEKYINSGGKEYQEIFNDTQTFKAEDLKGPLLWIASMLGICQQSCSK